MRLFGGNTKVKVERVNATSSMNVFNVQINIIILYTLQILYHFYIYILYIFKIINKQKTKILNSHEGNKMVDDDSII